MVSVYCGVAPAVFAAGGVIWTGKNTGDKIAGATQKICCR
jgi:hypothetical protein